jgi:hypothetical protein
VKFIIDGQEFEAVGLERVTGAMALDLPRQAGIGLQQVAKRLQEMPRLGYDASGTPVVVDEKIAQTPEGAAMVDGSAVLDSEPHLRALLAFLWVSRRLDGDRTLTFEKSCEFPMTGLEIVDDEPEVEDVEPDPTQPGSDPVAAPAELP